MIDDLYLTFKIGLDTASADLTQVVITNIVSCIKSISIENDGTKLFDITGLRALAAVIAEEAISMTQHMTNEGFVDYWFFHPAGSNAGITLNGDANIFSKLRIFFGKFNTVPV